MVSRLTEAHLCTYTDIVTGDVTIKDFYKMQAIVDWQNYKAELKAEREKQQYENSRR